MDRKFYHERPLSSLASVVEEDGKTVARLLLTNGQAEGASHVMQLQNPDDDLTIF